METQSFSSALEFRSWLEKHHVQSNGLLLRIYNKDSGIATVTYAEALDQALCFGWIDGQKLPLDEKSWVQKFTPRRPNSSWSKKNTEHVARLMKSGEMTAAGLKQIEAAKADGRWKAAYDSPSNTFVPKEFLVALARNKKASAFYKTLNKTNLYSIAYRLQMAKRPETKIKRMKSIVEMLARATATENFRKRPARGFSDCLVVEIARKAGHLPLGTFDRALAKLTGTVRLRPTAHGSA